jgi:phosphoribosylcarboxyaminoimidazole (NCAIR) mutase
MNLVRLSFIVGMTSLAGYSLYSAVTRPYQAPVATIATTQAVCNWSGGYDNVGFFILATFAILAALTVACVDLARRVY